MNYIPAQAVKDFFNLLNSSKIEYVLIKNVAEELPERLQDGKDIDILVNENQIDKFDKYMRTYNYKKQNHPYGKKAGWGFAYKLPEHQFWKYKNNDFTLYIDTAFKLCCRSLTPNVWIPLDNCINADIWKNKVFDKHNNWWIMDDETILIYMFCRAIFDKKEFKPGYIAEIEKRKSLLNNDSTKYKLSKVFFKYTEPLIEQAENGSYETIINNYLTFKNY